MELYKVIDYGTAHPPDIDGYLCDSIDGSPQRHHTPSRRAEGQAPGTVDLYSVIQRQITGLLDYCLLVGFQPLQLLTKRFLPPRHPSEFIAKRPDLFVVRLAHLIKTDTAHVLMDFVRI